MEKKWFPSFWLREEKLSRQLTTPSVEIDQINHQELML